MIVLLLNFKGFDPGFVSVVLKVCILVDGDNSQVRLNIIGYYLPATAPADLHRAGLRDYFQILYFTAIGGVFCILNFNCFPLFVNKLQVFKVIKMLENYILILSTLLSTY